MTFNWEDCSYYFLDLNPACTTSTTSTSTSTSTTSSTTSSTTTSTTTIAPTTTTLAPTTTTSSSTTTTTTTIVPKSEYCLYWEDTNIVHRLYLNGIGDNIYLTTSLLGVYIDSRDNILYGGDTTFYTNSSRLYWSQNRTGWYVEFIVDGITYGPYIYDITGSVGTQLSAGQLAVDKSYVVYKPSLEIQLFGSLQFSTTPYIGTLNPNVLNIGAGDSMRIYKEDCNVNLLTT